MNHQLAYSICFTFTCINLLLYYVHWEPGSSISIVAGYGLGDQGLMPHRGGGFFLYPLHPAGSGKHSASCTMGTGDSFLTGKMLTTHPPSNAKVKTERGYTTFAHRHQSWYIMGRARACVCVFVRARARVMFTVLHFEHYCPFNIFKDRSETSKCNIFGANTFENSYAFQRVHY
jgi:hypothetical protein